MKKLTLLLAFLLTINLTSAVIINSVETQTLAPGQEGTIRIELENIQNKDAKDVSLQLIYTGLPFIPIGTSEQSTDEIEDDEDEDFVFRIKANSEITPGDYEIPYILEYEIDDETKTREGSIGIKVAANPELSFTADTENPIVGRQGQISLKIVNKGFYNARFVSVKLIPSRFTLLSGEEVYIGEIDSDDFETATFDVIFQKTNPFLESIVEYTNFNNEKVTETVKIPLTVYTTEKAIELGILSPNKTTSYTITVVVLVALFLIWRSWRKRRRAKKAKLNNQKL